MISEDVLEELARPTPFREQLVTLIWPSLSVESKLQVMQEIQTGSGVGGYTPDWLVTFALEDPSAAVRYWGARKAYFRSGNKLLPPALISFGVSDAERARFGKVRSDPTELVREFARDESVTDFTALSKLPQTVRLSLIRSATLPDLTAFVKWLSERVDAGADDDELGDCAEEFFAHRHVQQHIRRDPLDYDDGLDAHYAGEAVTVGWRMCRKAGPRLQHVLAQSLPTAAGLGKMGARELATMPEAVLSAVLYRRVHTAETRSLIELLQQHPEKSSPEVRSAIDSIGEAEAADDWETRRRKAATDRGRATLETVLELRDAVAKLAAEVSELKEAAANKKRRLFG